MARLRSTLIPLGWTVVPMLVLVIVEGRRWV